MKRTSIWVVAAALLAVPGLAAAEGYPFEFQAGSPSAVLGPRFQPMSSSVPLKETPNGPKEGLEHREGYLRIGEPTDKPRRVVVSRTKAGEAFDRLLLDTDGDGSVDDETPVEAKMQSSGRTVWSSFMVVLRVDHGRPGKPQVEEHPFKTWLAVADKTSAPDAFHYASVGFRRGHIEIEGGAYDVVLTDRNNDARYGPGDAWTMQSTERAGPARAGDAHGLDDAVNAGGRNWNLVLDDTGGRHAHLVIQGESPGPRPEVRGGNEPRDRGVPRAEVALEFAASLEEGRKQAAKIQGPLYLAFESGSNAASVALRENVYAARTVVEQAAGLTSVHVDLDGAPALKEQYKVSEAPTGILLDPEGNEVARFSGPLSAEDFVAFLAAVHPWLLPADDEPKLDGKNRARHEKIVKEHVAYLEDNKHQGLLVDRIKDLGTRKNRSVRDALMRFAATRKSKEYVAEAFFALATIGGRVGLEFLCGPKALRSKDYLVAQQAALALGTAKDGRALSALLEVLNLRGTKIEVVSACCLALAKSAPEDEIVIQEIFRHCEEPKDTIRAGAAEALGYLKSDAAVQRLQQLLQVDKNTRVRAAAALGMGHTGRTELIPALRKAIAEDKAHTVRTSALEAIRELQGEAPAATR